MLHNRKGEGRYWKTWKTSYVLFLMKIKWDQHKSNKWWETTWQKVVFSLWGDTEGGEEEQEALQSPPFSCLCLFPSFPLTPSLSPFFSTSLSLSSFFLSLSHTPTSFSLPFRCLKIWKVSCLPGLSTKKERKEKTTCQITVMHYLI